MASATCSVSNFCSSMSSFSSLPESQISLLQNTSRRQKITETEAASLEKTDRKTKNPTAGSSSALSRSFFSNFFDFEKNRDVSRPYGGRRRKRSTEGRTVRSCTDFSFASQEMREAARQMVDYFVRSGSVIGVGSGGASLEAIQYIGRCVSEGRYRDLQAVPMCSSSAAEAAKVGLPLTTLEAHPKLDFAFTDADLVQEGTLYGIIGRRGVFGRESVVTEKKIAHSANQFVFLVGEKEFVENLEGSIPVIIEQENWLDIAEEIDDCFLGDAEVWRRPSSGTAGPLGGDFPLITPQGHFVLDVIFTTPVQDSAQTVEVLESVAGVVAHGLFLNQACAAAVGGREGVKIRTSLFREAFTTKNPSF